MKNKFYISSQVFDQFRELNDTEKWDGIKGESTTASGFQFWERIKETSQKIFLIHSTKRKEQK